MNEREELIIDVQSLLKQPSGVWCSLSERSAGGAEAAFHYHSLKVCSRNKSKQANEFQFQILLRTEQLKGITSIQDVRKLHK